MEEGHERTLIFRELSKNWQAGKCTLCHKHTDHLERHHVRYRPERTIDLCHKCHHTIHYWPARVPDDHIVKLMLLYVNPYMKWWYRQNTERLLTLYHSLVDRARTHKAHVLAPSRKEFLEKESMEKEEKKKKKKKEEKSMQAGRQAAQERERNSLRAKIKVLTKQTNGTNKRIC